MVSLWPWKGEDNSPASFEKTLSALAGKIAKSQSQLDSLRQTGRRFKALWTLYTSFAYLLCTIGLFLVVGWKNWGASEYSALAGSPVVIYLIRLLITLYFEYRVDTVTQRLEDQHAERAKTIDKLKAATKYNSTQELLEKYGGVPKKEKKPAAPKPPNSPAPNQMPRMPMGPPPTANIPRPNQIPNQIPNQPSTPQAIPSPISPDHQQGSAEFAPNAYPAPSQYAQTNNMNMGANWYDRVLDLLMGEDETAPKNRMVLICQNCRLVNGQAPPGTRTLADLGKWKCYSCGTMNGEEDEAAQVVQEMKERIQGQDKDQPSSVESEDVKTVDKKPEIEDREAKEAEEEKVADEADVDSVEEVVEPRPKKGRSRSHKKN